jgi:hypothetical protein
MASTTVPRGWGSVEADARLRVYLIHGPGIPAEYLGFNDGLDEAVADLREHWCEGAGPQRFELRDESGYLVATMWRPRPGPEEACLTCYDDGHVERHTCRYLTDAEGRYTGTEIRAV